MRIFILLGLSMILFGCVPAEEGNISVYFCPGECEEVFRSFVMNKVDCALYDLDYPELFDGRVLLDNENGIDGFRTDTSSQLSHNKFCVYDNMVLTGSTNPTYRGFNTNANNIIVIESELIAQNYKDEFAELWGGTFGGGKKVRTPVIRFNNHTLKNYFCPEDSCKRHVMEELRDAKKSVYFMTFSFTDHDIAKLLVELNKEISVKGVLEGQRINMRYNKFDYLNESVSVYPDGSSGTMHHKVFIIDNETVITGSYNPTKSGNERNDENILIIEEPDVVSAFVSEFQKIYNIARD